MLCAVLLCAGVFPQQAWRGAWRGAGMEGARVASPLPPVGGSQNEEGGALDFNTAFLFLLFIFRERIREGERGRETSMCGCLSLTPY